MKHSSVSVGFAFGMMVLAALSVNFKAPWAFASSALGVVFFLLWAIVEAIRESRKP